MRAAIFEEAGRPLNVVTVEDPRPAPDQVVIEVAHCGICGSDLHVTQQGLVPSGTILGHEFAGTIVEIGREVGGDWRVGDRVTALPIQACRSCEPCAIGLPGLCSSVLFTGTTLETPGAYAQYVRARRTMLQLSLIHIFASHRSGPRAGRLPYRHIACDRCRRCGGRREFRAR